MTTDERLTKLEYDLDWMRTQIAILARLIGELTADIKTAATR